MNSEPLVLRISAPSKDLGGFSVRRALPSAERRMVGPFAFFDHFGPAKMPPGQGIDVRPHPHIGLATVTYLFDGEIMHRDSLGFAQAIQPGAINWMVAGRGIVHSERTRPELRASGFSVHGLQVWIALPKAHEEDEPSFQHHPAASLPERNVDGSSLRVLLGTAYGMTSPVATHSPIFYVDVSLPAGAEWTLPSEEYEERGAYVVQGVVHSGEQRAEPGDMLVFAPGAPAMLRAESAARVALLGGAPLDGERYIDWNFVSSSKARLEQARKDWKENRFPRVPGDDVEFIPLPE